MKWFKRHLNWTYILTNIIASILLVVIISLPPSEETALKDLKIYIDNIYTQEWDTVNVPNLETLNWFPDNENVMWEKANLIVYLENTGDHTINIEVSGHLPQIYRPGWSASSEVITLNPGERSPIVIEISHHIFISAEPQFYFNAEPITSTGNDTLILIGLAIALILIISVGIWVLNRKGRSYAWILVLFLSWIGLIIFLNLENKRQKITSSMVIEPK